MKNKMFTFVLSLATIFCVFAMGQSAADSPLASGLRTQAIDTCGGDFCDSVYIEEIWFHDSGTLYINTSGDENALNCTSLGNRYVQIGENDQSFKEIYTALLAAHLADKRVIFQMKPAGNPCVITSIVMKRGL